MKSSWKYYRWPDHKCSKWVLGNSWVTRYDESQGCVIGVNGTRRDGLYIGQPREARTFVENALRKASRPETADSVEDASKSSHGSE